MLAKISLALSLSALLAAPAFAQTPAAPSQALVPPRPSPNAKLEQFAGVSKITITYSRPGVKGREIFGGLVPYGEVWRTGANEATLFETSHDATIGGQKLAAGKYAFFTIPGKDKWTLIWNRQAEQWGAGNYKPEEDALKIDVMPQTIPAQERFEIRALDADDTTVKLELRWSTVMVPFSVTFDTPKLAVAYAKELAAKAASKDEARALSGWASWSLQSGVGLADAEGWIAKAAAENDSYRIHATHARILAKNGKVKEANAAADKALARAAGADAEAPGVAADAENLKKERASWK